MTTCDWTAIRAAFPLTEVPLWSGVVLRPLEQSDCDALSEIMAGDPEMTWPRKAWTRENVDYLLGLRLKHYADYGFGPYAILRSGRLIGMAGAQVWDYAPCSIEVLAYVARSEWSRGLAVRVLNWTIERAATFGDVKSIYAATRPENVRAVRLARGLGFAEAGAGEHYGYPAMFWQLSLDDVPNEASLGRHISPGSSERDARFRRRS